MMGQEPRFRVRQKHSRSRTGCITCRVRHIRCEEQRPRCSNCERASKECVYAPIGQPVISIRSKAKLPGAAAPWQVIPQISVTRGDPFDALPIAMPFQSMGMLQFFMQTNSQVGHFIPPHLWKDNIASSNMDPTFCRSLVLISAAFFAGCAGNLREFEPAYLHHKIETIRTVNMWLSQPKTQLKLQCLNLIGTLLLTEAYLGYDTIAEHHFAGLRRLLDFRQHQYHSTQADHQESSEESGLVERYHILTQAITKTTSHLNHSRGSSKPSSSSPSYLSTADHDNMVESIRLMPYFFVDLSVQNDKVVDITKPVNELKFLVSLLNPPAIPAVQESEQSPASNVAQIILTANRLHVESLFSVHRSFSTTQEPGTISCTWQTFISARYCFQYGVIGLHKLGPPTEANLPSHLDTILQTDTNPNPSAPAPNKHNSDLWIWMLLSAALTLSRFQHALRNLCGMHLVKQWHRIVATYIQAWGKSQNVHVWHCVEDALKRIAWPEDQCEETITVWHVMNSANSLSA